MAGSSMRAGGIHWAATMDAGGFEKGARKVRTETRGVMGALNELKSVFGRGSAFKEGLEVILGGGAIAGAGMAARALKNMTGAFRELADGMGDPAISRGDLFRNFIESVPLFGSLTVAVHDAADAMTSLFTGVSNAGSAAAKQAKALADELSRIPKGVLEGVVSGGRLDAALANANPGDVAKIQEQDRLRRELEEIDKRRGEFFDAANAKGVTIRLEDDEQFFEAREQARINSANRIIKIENDARREREAADLKAIYAEENARNAAAEQRERDEYDARLAKSDAEDAAIEREEAAARRIEEAKERAREKAVSEAQGIFEQLKAIESTPVRFGGGVERGTQEDFANRQRAIFGSTVYRQNEKQLAEKAVKLQEENKRQNDRVIRLIEDVGKKLGVTDFN